MLLRLILKAVALLAFFLTTYLLYSILVLLLVEILHVSPLPLRFPWSLASLFSFVVSGIVAVYLFRGLKRTVGRRGRLARG
jgi:hypothetical protein